MQSFYKSNGLAKKLDPSGGIIRECRDSVEHPNTIPVILALDVTGSMGSAAKACAAKLDDIMTKLYDNVQDVEFMMMGIGDLAFDDAPIQASQFESDIRILDQTAMIYFEAGGGSNAWESYTAAWYFGLHNTDLDCWKRGKKGIVITIGDEPLNPYLPVSNLRNILNGNQELMGELNDEIDTQKLFNEASKKFDIYHIAITDVETNYSHWQPMIHSTWKKLLGQRYLEGKSTDLDKLINEIVTNSVNSYVGVENGIAW